MTVRDAPESSPALRRLPAWILLGGVLWGAPLAAQAVRLPSDSRVYKTPGGVPLGTVLAGAAVTPGARQDAAIEIGLEGWIATSSLGPFNRDGFDAVITRRPQENLRDAPNGKVIARFAAGAGFTRVEAQGGWTRVRRKVWLPERSLPAAVPAAAAAGPGWFELVGRAPLALVPGGTPIGTLDSGAMGRSVARSGAWTRLQFEVWVPDSLARPAPDQVLRGVSAAEIRADPGRFLGKVLEWRLQFVALQKADELRPEIPPGREYLLARGPLPEPGFVYVVLDPSQVRQFEGLPPLKELVLRGTLRAATSKYLPTPILDLVAIVEGAEPSS